jgi:hypothetical protein
VLPPNFRDVTAEKVGTVMGIVGATEAEAEIGPGPAAPAPPCGFQARAIGHGPGQSGGQMPNRLAPTKMHPVHSRSGVPSMVTRSRSAQAKNLPKLG